ncbi:DUF2752 domain-containing protein [Nocardioides plantarum]|uniref:DUF2752 domain-containing protein n=1 Tax=Nocardioides plantarum TaxID=29299 RepID=A0ABV5KID3_9ACTN|nr:DUF2752 domain-containing protein [Nocardioides plantarum]
MPRAAPSADLRPHHAPVTTVLVAAGAAAALGAAFWISPDHVEDGPVICPFRRLTGLPCPGCGLTRSWVYLAHGQWHDSVAAHPFGPVAVAMAVALVVSVVVALVRRGPLPDLDVLVRRPWVVAVVGAWLAFGAVRLVLAL